MKFYNTPIYLRIVCLQGLPLFFSDKFSAYTLKMLYSVSYYVEWNKFLWFAKEKKGDSRDKVDFTEITKETVVRQWFLMLCFIRKMR